MEDFLDDILIEPKFFDEDKTDTIRTLRLQKIRTVEGLKDCSVEELRSIGISFGVAKEIIRVLHPTGRHSLP